MSGGPTDCVHFNYQSAIKVYTMYMSENVNMVSHAQRGYTLKTNTHRRCVLYPHSRLFIHLVWGGVEWRDGVCVSPEEETISPCETPLGDRHHILPCLVSFNPLLSPSPSFTLGRPDHGNSDVKAHWTKAP